MTGIANIVAYVAGVCAAAYVGRWLGYYQHRHEREIMAAFIDVLSWLGYYQHRHEREIMAAFIDVLSTHVSELRGDRSRANCSRHGND